MEKVYHYTKIKNGNVKVLESIIQKDAIHMHSSFFRKYAKEDYLWIKNYSKDIVKDICKSERWDYDVDALAIKPYFVSFCIDTNSSYMWENYGDLRRGIKLIFDKDILRKCEHLNPDGHGNFSNAIETTLPCIYIDKKAEMRQQILEHINDKELLPWSNFDRLRFLVAAIKQTKPYKEEQEYRHIHLYPIEFTSKYNAGNYYFEDDEGPIDKENMWIDLLFPKEMLLGIEFGQDTTKEDLQYVRNHIKSVGYDPRIVKVTPYKDN